MRFSVSFVHCPCQPLADFRAGFYPLSRAASNFSCSALDRADVVERNHRGGDAAHAVWVREVTPELSRKQHRLEDATTIALGARSLVSRTRAAAVRDRRAALYSGAVA